MNIFLLILFSGSISFLAINTLNLKILSPTFISSGMFFVFSVIYLLNFGYMGSDIELITVFYILLTLFFTYCGEFFIDKISGNRLKKHVDSKSTMKIKFPSFWVTLVITVIMLFVAYIRYSNLRYFAAQYGNFSDFIGLMKVARVAVNQGEAFNLGGGLVSQIVYLSTGICFYYTYLFIYELVVGGRIVKYLAFPIIADGLIEISTTGRTPLIIIAVGFIVSYFHIVMTYNSDRKIKIDRRVYYFLGLFLIAFFIYGSARTGNSKDITSTVSGAITSYSSAAIYGLDHYLKYQWLPNPYFAAYTGKFLYATLGIQHNFIPNSNLPFFFYGNEGYSNIYTSIVLPLQDYGFAWMLISRVVLATISAWILKIFVNKKPSEVSFYIYLLLSIFIIYCYVNVPISDRFYTYFLNPVLILRYVFYTLLFSFMMQRVRFKFR